MGGWIGADHRRLGFALEETGVLCRFLKSIPGVAVSPVHAQLDTMLEPHSQQFLEGLLKEGWVSSWNETVSGHGARVFWPWALLDI